jgi:arabinose-5-phosphate isomerase
MLTKYAMSVLLIEESGKLAGIISEKDIRVAMEKYGADVFKKEARELMNARPITIEGDMLAVDALKLMKDRPRPLNFLPIVHSDGSVAGLVRLHDLVNAGIGLV